MSKGSAVGKSHPLGIPSTLQVKNMNRQFNESDYSFLIETFTDNGERLMMWRIDQCIGNPRFSHLVDAATNRIETHLHWLYGRTGLNYSCFAQGPKEEIDKAIQSLGLEVF